jgi:hypothetical protein
MRNQTGRFMKYALKYVIILFFISLISCKDLQRGNKSFENINKLMLFFNYDTNELCLLDIDTGLIETKNKIDFYVQKYVVDKNGYNSKWYYSNANKSLYLLRNHIDWNDSSNNDARIYKINIDTFESSEIYYSKNKFYEFCVTDDYLYLLNYVEPSNGKSNKEKNYIVRYNFQKNTEEIIYFNKLIPEDKQVYAVYFHVLDDEIILKGRTGETLGFEILINNNLYKYDMSTEIMYVLDEKVYRFSIFNDKILYCKEDVDADNSNGINLIIYDLKSNNKINLSGIINSAHSGELLVDENIMIFSRERKTIRSIIDKFWIFPSRKRLNDYYIADISENVQKKFFKSRDEIDIFGIIDKKHPKRSEVNL